MIITSGINNNPLTKNLFFTKFTTDTTTLKSRKQIIEGVTNTNASVKVSSFGANGQIEVSSVLSIDGFFKRGEAIKAFDKSGSYTLGISELDSTELQTILTHPDQPQRTTKLIHHFNSIKPDK
jgi:glutamate 5-kinase